MSIASEIIVKLGGIRPLARKLNIDRHTVVQGWKDRGTIPVEHWPAVIAVAAGQDIELTSDHLSGITPIADLGSLNTPNGPSIGEAHQ